MTILKIYTFQDKVLHQKSIKIKKVTKEIIELAQSMLETMYDANAVGLAANQVGALKRLIVLDSDYRVKHLVIDNPLRFRNPVIMINPKIISKSGTMEGREGCLSIPSVFKERKRHAKIRVSYLDLNGMETILDTEGYQSVIIQHEIDHLDGKLFVDDELLKSIFT